ncbi:intermembrane transport protein PqiB [Motiliproteus sp. SC1-56]|uniref:intermembrane transport protein PqiB n=1 Tax=Motiliproteus sp. SC1-56 TaxID=2799565 RepID=UPI001A8C8D83
MSRRAAPVSQEARARVSRQPRLSPIWIVPLVATLIGLWLLYDNYLGRGPEIILIMENAEGIEAGKTLIKTRNVEVGRVESVTLDKDHEHARLRARMSPETQPLLVEDSRFWVVKPRIGRQGISGLGTVLSGAFIQLEPGESDAARRRFEVSEQPPVAAPGAEGKRLTLISQQGHSLRVGDPVSYRGFVVGRIEMVTFNPEIRQVRHGIFIEAPYDDLVTTGSRFWSASAFNLSFDTDGLKVSVDSLESLLTGGVTFAVPTGLPAGEPVAAETTFALYPDRETAHEGTFNRYLEYVLLVEESVSDLKIGAPVRFRGVRIGTVAAVPWHFNDPPGLFLEDRRIPLLLRIEPQRLGGSRDELDLKAWAQRFEEFFTEGLRASLDTDNLLTGALFVNLHFVAEPAPYMAQQFHHQPVMPGTAGGSQLERQAGELLAKLNALEVEPLLASLKANLEASEAMLREVRTLSRGLQAYLDAPDTQALPANINATLGSLDATLQGLSPRSSAYRTILDAAQSLDRLVRDLRPTAQALGDDPRALLLQTSNGDDPQPRAPAGEPSP